MTLIAPRVSADPEIQSGKPVIEGTRMPVSVIVGAVAAGDSIESIAHEYSITSEDVHAALGYAARVLDEESIRAAG
jgi:uncharacterized protein (DUF433 family)